jgi:hypothetical protein
MKKSLKIVLVVFAVLVISAVSFFAVVIGDVAGNFATGTHPLPNGVANGKAIIIYDPGLTGGAKDVATKIGYNLQTAGYDVLLAGVKSSAAGNLTGYSVVVVGGPIYAGKPAGTVQTCLNNLQPSGQSHEKLDRKNSILLPDPMGRTKIHNRSLPNIGAKKPIFHIGLMG